MRLGIFAKTFARPSLEEVFDALVQYGLETFQFNFACAGLPSLPEAVEPGLWRRIRAAGETRGLVMAGVSATFNMIHPDLAQRREGLRRLGMVIDGCSELGTSLVSLCTGTRDPGNMWRAHPDNEQPEAWRDLLASLTAVLPQAEARGVILAVEPETGNVVNSALRARSLLDELKSASLRIILDPANLVHPGHRPRMREIMDEALDVLGDDLVMAHAKELGEDDHPAEPSVALGEGVLDWDYYLNGLRRVGFEGALIMHGFEEAQVGRSLTFLRDKLRASGQN